MKKKLLIGILFLGLVVALGFSLTYMGLFINTTSDVQQEEQVSKMRIALVNEDIGTEFEGNPFSLGENYVKKIEKDGTQNWYVVSRSIAESGLANDTYNLMIVIPSNFSANTFSLNEEEPEKAEVSYKINANGNKDIENEAIKVAKNTISELNKNLVDVYISSILENLYTAQKNVGTVIGNQIEKINIYGEQVYNPLEGYTNQFSTIQAVGDQSQNEIAQHKSVLTNYLDSFISYGTNQTDFDKNLKTLIAEQEKNKTSYEKFTSSLTDYGMMLGSQETQVLYDSLVEQNKLIGAEFTNSDATLVNQIAIAADYIAEVKIAILNQRADIEKQFEDDKKVLTQSVTEKLSQQYGITDGKLSIAELLLPEGKDFSGNLETIRLQELERINSLALKISQLVYWGDTELANSPYPDDTSKAEMVALLNQIKSYLEVTPTSDNLSALVTPDEVNAGHLIAPPFQNPLENTIKVSNYQDLSALETELIGIEDKASYDQKIYDVSGGVKDYSTLTKLNIKLLVPTEIEVTSAYIKLASGERQLTPAELTKLFEQNGVELENLKLSNNFYIRITYRFNRQGAATPDYNLVDLADKKSQMNVTPIVLIPSSDPNIPPVWKPGATAINSKPIGFPTSSFNKEDYLLKIKNYKDVQYKNGVWTGKYITDYQTVLDELTLLFGPLNAVTGKLDNLEKPRQASTFYDELINDTENFNIFDLLVKLMLLEPTSIYNGYLTNFEEYERSADEMEIKVESLNSKVSETTETANQLNEEVSMQLATLREWKKKMNELERAESATSSLTEGEHSGTRQIESELKSLLSYSETLKTTSESNIEDLTAMNTIFVDFNKDALAIQDSGIKVTKSTKDLMGQFEGQVKETEDFSKTFNNVLKNGQQNGVINNQLVDFLASPVKEKDNGRISSGDAYYPYLIVIALFITAIFTAYVLDLKVWQIRQVNSFQVEENLFIRNLPLVIFGLVASVIEGGFIALVSFRMQSMNSDIQLNWVTVIILVQIVFVFLASYLQRQFKMLGMFINLFLFASYLLLTEAVGKALDSEAVFYIIRDFSPLNKAELILGNVANQVQNTTTNLVNFFILIPIVLLLNLLVWFPKKRKASEIEEAKE